MDKPLLVLMQRPARDAYTEHFRRLRITDRALPPGAPRPQWHMEWSGANSPGALWAQWFEWAAGVRRAGGWAPAATNSRNWAQSGTFAASC